jgi:hypothetical protein
MAGGLSVESPADWGAAGKVNLKLQAGRRRGENNKIMEAGATGTKVPIVCHWLIMPSKGSHDPTAEA